MDASAKLCRCGCGRAIAPGRSYVRGHNLRGTRTGSWIEQGHRFLWRDGRRIAEHRYVVEQALGRKLSSKEIVHHVDGDPLNNALDNLVILTRAEHARLHFAGKTVKRWSDAERVRAQTLYDAGLTVDEVAVALARPYESTRETLQRRGCTRTPAETRKLRQKQFAQFREAAQLSPRIVDQLITASPSESSDSSTHHARTGSASAQPA